MYIKISLFLGKYPDFLEDKTNKNFGCFRKFQKMRFGHSYSVVGTPPTCLANVQSLEKKFIDGFP